MQKKEQAKKQKKQRTKSQKQIEQLKSITKIIRISPKEYQKISEKMAESGIKNFSYYAISSMLQRRAIATPLNKSFVLELARQGNNLNQIAYKLNSSKAYKIDNEQEKLLNEILSTYKELIKAYTNAS